MKRLKQIRKKVDLKQMSRCTVGRPNEVVRPTVASEQAQSGKWLKNIIGRPFIFFRTSEDFEKF